MMSDDGSQLPLFERWRDGFTGAPLGLWDYAAIVGGWTLAASFATLFWPRLAEAEGCVVLADHYSQAGLADWLDSLDGDREQVERVVNHVHLWDLFANAPDHIPEIHQNELALVLSKTWAAAAADQLPQHAINVVVEYEPDEYGPTITLFVDRGARSAKHSNDRP